MKNNEDTQLDLYPKVSQSNTEEDVKEIRKQTNENIEVVDNSTSGYDKLESSAYTRKEYVDAEQMQIEIVDKLRLFMRIGMEMAEKIYWFKCKEMYARLGYETFADWCFGVGLPKSTLNKYVATFEALTIQMKIKREEYENVEIGRVREIAKLVKIPASKKVILESLEVSGTLITQDFDEYIREIKTEYGIRNEALNSTETVQKMKSELKIPTKNILGLYNLSETAERIEEPSENLIANELTEVREVSLNLFYYPDSKNFHFLIKKNETP